MYAMWKDYDNMSVNNPNFKFKFKVDLNPNAYFWANKDVY